MWINFYGFIRIKKKLMHTHTQNKQKAKQLRISVVPLEVRPESMTNLAHEVFNILEVILDFTGV